MKVFQALTGIMVLPVSWRIADAMLAMRQSGLKVFIMP